MHMTIDFERTPMDPMKCYLPELDPRNQPRAYTRLTCEGRSCIFEPEEAAAIMRDAPGVYTASSEWMPQSLWEKLPEFAGW
jgi:hypothetical protein